MAGQGAVVRFTGLISAMLLTRFLGAVEFGTYSIFSNTGNSVYGLLRLGSDASVTMLASRVSTTESSRTEKGRVLGAGLILTMLLSVSGLVLCFFAAKPIASLVFQRPELAPWVSLAAASVFVQCFNQYLYSVIMGLQRVVQYSNAMIWNSLAGLALLVAGGIYYGLPGAALSFVIGQIISTISLALIVRRAMVEDGVAFQLDEVSKNIRLIISFGFPFYLSGLMMIPASYYAQGMLVALRGVEEAGGLRVVVAVTTLVSFIPTVTVPLVLNRLARASSESADVFSSTFSTLLRVNWAFAVIAGVLIALLVPLIIPVLFGSEYSRYSPAAILALLSSMFTSVLGVVASAVLSKGRMHLILAYTAFQAIVFTATASFLIPALGMAGYFVSEIFGYAAIMSFLVIYNRVTRTMAVLSWHRYACIASLVYASSLALMSVAGAGYASATGVVALAIIGAMIFNKVMTEAEREMVRAAFAGRPSRPWSS